MNLALYIPSDISHEGTLQIDGDVRIDGFFSGTFLENLPRIFSEIFLKAPSAVYPFGNFLPELPSEAPLGDFLWKIPSELTSGTAFGHFLRQLIT